MIPSSEYDLLSKHGEGVHMERIWNIGSVQIVDDSKLPPVHHKSNQVVLINNANHGSAHLAMFFAFPAISFVNSFDVEIIGIRHRIHDYHSQSQNVPWAKDMVPLLPLLLRRDNNDPNTTPVPTISVHGFHHETLSCHRSVLFHQVNMRSRFSSIEVVPRWFFNPRIAQATATLVEQHTRSDIRTREQNMLQQGIQCRVFVVLRKTSLQGLPTSRHVTNIETMLETIETFFNSVKPEFKVCTVWFDGTSLGFQVQVIRKAAVVIAAHGAALTNAAWLPKCGVLLELFPALVWNHGMYKGLVQDVGGIYRSLASIRITDDAIGTAGCMEKHLAAYGESEIKRECTHDMECSECSRNQNITIDEKILLGKLTGAWEERIACSRKDEE